MWPSTKIITAAIIRGQDIATSRKGTAGPKTPHQNLTLLLLKEEQRQLPPSSQAAKTMTKSTPPKDSQHQTKPIGSLWITVFTSLFFNFETHFKGQEITLARLYSKQPILSSPIQNFLDWLFVRKANQVILV